MKKEGRNRKNSIHNEWNEMESLLKSHHKNEEENNRELNEKIQKR